MRPNVDSHWLLDIRICLFSLILSFSFYPPALGQTGAKSGTATYTTKFSPLLLKHLENKAGNEKIEIQLYIDSIGLPYLIKSLGSEFTIHHEYNGLAVAKGSLSKSQINDVAQQPFVQFIELERAPSVEFKQEGLDLTLNEVTMLHHQYPGLGGTGMSICIKENLFDTNDIDFKNRITSLELASTHVDMHATNMATISAGGGNSSHTAKGVAWDAYISSSDFIRLTPDPDQHFVSHNISVQNHAYGTGIENYYGMETFLYDESTNRLPWLVHVFSSGNIGDQTPSEGKYAGLAGLANITGQFKQSKNTITVGATDSLDQVVPLSSHGPAYDGRIKPEIVAYGHGGSSGAAAIVSGISILIQQAYMETFGELPPSSLVKAVLINTANDIGTKGPDFKSGFGSVNAINAIHSIYENRFMIQTLSEGETISIPFMIPGQLESAEFTIAWNDPAAEILSSKALVNNLDIELEYIASGERWLPWILSSFPHPDSLSGPASQGVDTLNNVEKITAEFLPSGNYLLHIKGEEIKSPSQEFSLSWQFNNENKFIWTFPSRDDHLLPGTKNIIRWNSNKTENGRIDFRRIGEDWTTLIADIDPGPGYFIWNAPSIHGLGQLSWISSDTVIFSDTFLITSPREPKVELLCADSLVIQWQDPGQSDSFQILRLGDRHLEHYKFTQDTFFVEHNPGFSGKYYAVAPVYDHLTGPPSYAFDYTQQGAGCFLDVFYLRHVLDGIAYFSAVLSAIDEIDFIVLQKLVNGSFTDVRILNPVDSAIVFLESEKLRIGVNDFRLKVVLNNGEEIFSQTERIYFAGDKEVLLFPNPVRASSDVTLITSGIDDFELIVYDMQGREISIQEHLESPFIFSSAGLSAGIYILQLISDDGSIYFDQLHVY